jgi:hypothetical protein
VNRQDTALLLGMCAAYDQRTIGDADALAWHEILSDLDFDDAKLAVVAHYRTETRRVMPADIRAAVKKIRAERVTHPDEIPDADPDDVPAYVVALRQGRYVRASGGTIPVPDLRLLTRRIGDES